jgi:hypothetical protein
MPSHNFKVRKLIENQFNLICNWLQVTLRLNFEIAELIMNIQLGKSPFKNISTFKRVLKLTIDDVKFLNAILEGN